VHSWVTRIRTHEFWSQQIAYSDPWQAREKMTRIRESDTHDFMGTHEFFEEIKFIVKITVNEEM